MLSARLVAVTTNSSKTSCAIAGVATAPEYNAQVIARLRLTDAMNISPVLM